MGIDAASVGYLDNHRLAGALQKAALEHPAIVHLHRAARTPGGHDVWRVELGSGAESARLARPAMLVVAGIEGNDRAGSACAIAWIDHCIAGYGQKPPITALLDTATIHVWPRLNPDAADGLSSNCLHEIRVNRSPEDEDHDGLVDEDGPEDLDGDGQIAWMRVRDPNGSHRIDPREPRWLFPADPARGETGQWRLLVEGRDNDHDEAWNEDGPGGVDLNRNFPFQYQFFGLHAGPHPVSEPETRALADFMILHPHIGIVVAYGESDNLLQTPAAPAEGGSVSSGRGRAPVTSVHPSDLPYYRELGRLYRERLGLKKEIKSASVPGAFSDWAYFHRGRLGLSVRPWSPALELARNPAGSNPPPATASSASKSSAARAAPAPASRPGADTRNEEERNFLQWIDAHAPELFVPWKSWDHPDFPGKQVEIGGFAPFARSQPPEPMLGAIARDQARFLTDLAGKLPRVGLRGVQARHLGEGVFEVSARVENRGYLPTVLAHGQVTGEVLPTRITVDIEEKHVLGGSARVMLQPIQGSGGSQEVRWILHSPQPRRLKIEVVSALGGIAGQTIELKP